MLIDYIRQIHANQNFKLKDGFTFMQFDDITSESLTEENPIPDHIEIWASVKIPFEGVVPESYKILNLTIGDWVAQNEPKITKVIHNELKKHFKLHYPNSDISELDGGEDTCVWLDQLDYMPRVDDTEKTLTVEIELVLDAESIE